MNKKKKKGKSPFIVVLRVNGKAPKRIQQKPKKNNGQKIGNTSYIKSKHETFFLLEKKKNATRQPSHSRRGKNIPEKNHIEEKDGGSLESTNNAKQTNT